MNVCARVAVPFFFVLEEDEMNDFGVCAGKLMLDTFWEGTLTRGKTLRKSVEGTFMAKQGNDKRSSNHYLKKSAQELCLRGRLSPLSSVIHQNFMSYTHSGIHAR